MAPSVTRRLIDAFADHLPDPATGRSPTDARLEATVKTHVGRILTKLSVRDRVQVVVSAYEAGIARPGDR